VSNSGEGSAGAGMRLKEHERGYRLSFDNGISAEILRQGDAFGGLGQVRLGRRKLRSAELPIMPLIRTADGYEVTRLQIADIRTDADGIALRLAPYFSPTSRADGIHPGAADLWNVATWEQPAQRDRGGLFEVRLAPVERKLGGMEFVGFSYAYKFRSRRYRVPCIHDRATWELGGRATANRFWMAGPYNEPHKTFRNKKDSFTTAAPAAGGGAPGAAQFLPFFGCLQGFTFQFDAASLLVTAFEAVLNCRSLFQKDPGRNYLVHWHQMRAGLGGRVAFPPLQVLCGPSAAGDPSEQANRYCAIAEELNAAYRAQLGVNAEPAATSGLLVGAETCDVTCLERALDELTHTACERVYMPDLLSGLGHRSEPGPASATLRAAAGVIEHAHRRGMEVALPLSECCLPWVFRARGAEPPAVRPPRGRAMLEHLRALRPELGADALFPGGARQAARWQTMPAEHGPHDDRHEALDPGSVEELQRMGYRYAFGGPPLRVSYARVRGREFMFRDCVLEFPYHEITRAGEDPLVAYFRGCANRVSYIVTYDLTQGGAGRLPEWWRPDYALINRSYRAVRDQMQRPRLLPGSRGVLWDGAEPGIRVLWANSAFQWSPGDSAEVFDVMASKPVELDHGAFTTKPCRIYLIQGAPHAQAAGNGGPLQCRS